MSKCVERRPDGVSQDDPFEFDEVLADGIKSLHLERMDSGAFWLGIYLEDGREFHVNFWTDNRKGKRGAIYARLENA